MLNIDQLNVQPVVAENEEDYTLYIKFQNCYYLFGVYFEAGTPKL